MDNYIKKYKEILVNKTGKRHIYFLNYEPLFGHAQHSKKIKGYYAIDENNDKWISSEIASFLFNELVYDKFKSKFFDIDKNNQQQFFLIEQNHKFNSQAKTALLHIITTNTRQGTPRKFISLSDGEKANIAMSFKTISNFNFK